MTALDDEKVVFVAKDAVLHETGEATGVRARLSVCADAADRIRKSAWLQIEAALPSLPGYSQHLLWYLPDLSREPHN
jgi:hypothetical protein